jgi:hypothetical protein
MNEKEMSHARFHAATVAENMVAAYWMEHAGDSGTSDYLVSRAQESLVVLARHMGHTLAPIAAPVAMEAAE